MTETTFVPGFETVRKAIKAGEKFFEKANGQKGRYHRDFHVVKNYHGRFHFKEGERLVSDRDFSSAVEE